MIFNKTDYLQYLHCPESLWLLKHHPDEFPSGERSLFAEKLIQEGYQVEEYAKALFAGGIEIPSNATPEMTQEMIASGGIVYFQPSFITKQGVFARIDILERLADGTFCIYEVKSTNSIKTDSQHAQIKDVAFQAFVLHENGLKVSHVKIIHLNREFVKSGSIDPNELLQVVDVTNEVQHSQTETSQEIKLALTYLQQKEPPTECSCKLSTRSNHCDAFELLNPIFGPHPIYQINRISAKKINELLEMGITELEDIPSSFDLNTKQQLQVASKQQEKPTYQKSYIEKTLSELEYPLNFIDYETYPSAVPKVDGLSPHEHLTFQVSIHSLDENGALTHHEYLLENMELPKELLKFMEQTIGANGTFIAWHASFEIGRNRDMSKHFPEHTSFLTYMNEHMFDLEKLFFDHYVDYRFLGKTSIKNVLPILVPELSYGVLEIQDGTMALDTWGRWVLAKDASFEEREKIKQNLLAYCKLDTLAMVRIFEVLQQLPED